MGVFSSASADPFASAAPFASAEEEKGVDVSLAIDLIQATYEKRYEVAIIVSKDSDFGQRWRCGPAVATTHNDREVKDRLRSPHFLCDTTSSM